MKPDKLTFKVFNVEFDGMDKCGKETLVHTMFKVFPNYVAYQERGFLSQIAYNLLYKRDWKYLPTEGYISNSLFVKLDVEKEDWLQRLEATHEIESNKHRSDVDFVSDYERHRKAFDDGWEAMMSLDEAKGYQDHFLCLNTTGHTPEEVALKVKERLIKLNNLRL